MKIVKKIDKREPYTYEVLRSILIEKLNPTKLSRKVWLDCVEVLNSEGLAFDEIAMFLGSSVEDIRRDLKEIMKRNSKTDYLTQVYYKIDVVNGVPLTVRKSFQRFKRLPGANVYKAITRIIVEQEEIVNGKH